LFQNIWLDQDSTLNEDNWPENVSFKLDDIARLIQSLTHEFDESLLEVYVDLLIHCEDLRQF
jgi:hypothetical protein